MTDASSGKDADNTAPTLELLVEPLEQVGGPDLSPLLGGEGGEGEDLLFRPLHEGSTLSEPVLQGGGHLVRLGVHVCSRNTSDRLMPELTQSAATSTPRARRPP
jgi:hypothetical protein